MGGHFGMMRHMDVNAMSHHFKAQKWLAVDYNVLNGQCGDDPRTLIYVSFMCTGAMDPRHVPLAHPPFLRHYTPFSTYDLYPPSPTSHLHASQLYKSKNIHISYARECIMGNKGIVLGDSERKCL